MKASNPIEIPIENGEDIGRGMKPGGMVVQIRDDNHSGSTPAGVGVSAVKVKVAHGSNEFEVTVPSQSTFGDLKKVIAQETGLELNESRLLFRGKEKEDQEYLQLAGLKDNSKVLLMTDSPIKEKNIELVKGSGEVSKGVAAVAEVKAEVDKLSEQISALEAVVYGGTKVDEKDIVYLTEMLMRQLLKLDSIDAEGDGKVQRKMEVRRIQSFVETMDALKARNSNPFSNSSSAVSVTTQWETFDSGVGSLVPPPVTPSSTEVTQNWEHFDD